MLFSTSYLPSALVAGTAVTHSDSGPGGIYARLAELPLAVGTPVILVCRVAFEENGDVVEVNEMVLDSASYVLEYDFDAWPEGVLSELRRRCPGATDL